MTDNAHSPKDLVRRAGQPVKTITQPEYGYVTNYGPPNESERSDVSNVVEYLRILSHRKGTLLLIAVLGGIFGVLFTLPQTPIYQARATVEILGLNQDFMGARTMNPLTNMGTWTDMLDLQTQVRILSSRTLTSRVVDRLRPTVDPASIPVRRTLGWRKALGLNEGRKADPVTGSLKMAEGSLKVRAMPQTRIVEITTESNSPRVAADFANSLVDEYAEHSMQSRVQVTEKTSEFLARQLDEMKIRLEKSEDQLQDYARRTGLMFTSEKNSVLELRLRQLQDELSKAQADRITRQSRHEMAVSTPVENLPEVLNDPGLRDYRGKLTEMRRQLAELNTTYTGSHPRVKRLEAQIEPIETALKREREGILSRVRTEYEEALRREKLLADDYARQAGSVLEENERAIHYNILRREVDSNRHLYESMLQRVKEAGIASAIRANTVRVVDPASVPFGPSKPNPIMNTAFGLIAGIFAGVGFVLLRERADRTIQEPGESPKYLNLPELGVIPSANVVDGKKGLAAKALRVAADPGQRVELATFQRQPSMLAESFRAALVSIMFSGDTRDRPKVIVATSGAPGEGKTTTVCNLAIAMAEVQQKVLLIDADLRKPRLHDIFQIDNEAGLSTLLAGRRDERRFDQIVHHTDVPYLDVLTSGKWSPAAASLLYSPHLGRLLEEARHTYDTILIDTPPMLQISDARILGRLADAVVVIIRAHKTTRDAALASSRRLRSDGIRVLGTILNDWNPSKSGGGYYGNYSNYGKYYSYYKVPED